MGRELAIALRARTTWLVAAVAALLIGHGFVLAVDLFSAASRSALSNALQSKELDPLAGIVRPTLGGVDLALALLGPVVAARVVSIEKERGGFGALCLQVGSTTTVVLQKAVAAALATSLIVLPAVACLVVYRLAGAHVDALETAVALSGECLHVFVVVTASIAAAVWTSTFAQAATLGIVFSLTSWMIDAGEGFAALAWLGRAETFSIERHVATFQRGIVAVGPIAWLFTAGMAAVSFALVGARFDMTLPRRALVGGSIVVVTALLLGRLAHVHRAYDWTEQRRASLPPSVVTALRGIHAPMAIDVHLDRDDSRRRQLESDVLAKLLLARPDVTITFPLDERRDTSTGAHDDDYGRIFVRVGEAARETRSTSRKELVTLVLEAAGISSTDWAMPPYSGFPAVIEAGERRMVVVTAYGIVPLMFVAAGLLLSRGRSGR